jgi:hypothetical protein
MVLTVSFVISPVIGLSCHRHPQEALLLENLTPASRRQDHTTSPSASAPFVKSASASTASLPYVRDDRETPLCVGGDGAGYKTDLGQMGSNISDFPKLIACPASAGRLPASGAH